MWKIQLTITILFLLKMVTMKNVKCIQKENIEIMRNDKTDDVIEELCESLKKRYQNKFEEPMKGSEIVFDYVHLLHYKCHKIYLNPSESYIDSPDWIKNYTKK